MMKLTDALAIASTKFKTRKVRNAFAAFAVSLGMIIIFAFLFGVAGVLDFGKKVFVDSLSDRHFALSTFSTGYVEVDESGKPLLDGVESPQLPAGATDSEVWKSEHAEHPMKGVFHQRRIGGPGGSGFGLREDGLEGEQASESKRSLETFGLSVFATDPVFVTDFVYEGHSLDATVNGAIPIIIPRSILLNDFYVFGQDNAQQLMYEEAKKRAAEIVGKTFTLTRVIYGPEKAEYEPTDVKVAVVGVASDSFFSTPLYETYGIIIPNWAESHSDALKTLFTQYDEWRVLSEFATEEGRDAFVKAEEEKYGFGMFGPMVTEESASETVAPYTISVPTRFQAFAEMVNFFRSVAFGVGGFFLAISAIFIMTTLGKIIADSRKEIGIFRAVGAQKRDVKKIYFGYAWLLVTGGYVIGFVIAVILDLVASWKWGGDVFYQLMNAAIVTDIAQPAFMFLRITPLSMLGLYAGMMLVGVLASALPIRRASKIDPIKVLKDI
jgi:hypothetical protein